MLQKSCLIVTLLFMSLGAVAQSYFTELVVFGDSLLDSGNYGADRRATNQLTDGSGQFAQISPQYLAKHLGLALQPAIDGGSNYAVGGYQTQNVLNSVSGTGINTAFFGGGVSTSFLTDRANRVDPRAIVLINSGGNDLNTIFATVAPTGIPTAIQARAGNFNAAVAALYDAGAKYIMVSNVPDLAMTPGPQAALAAGFYTAATIGSISASTAGYNGLLAEAASGVLSAANIIPFDLDGALKYIMANADAYGLANGEINGLDQLYMCYNGGSGGCFEHPVYGINGAAPNPRKLLFNDALHPTGVTSEIVGDVLIDIVAAPSKIGLLPELGLNAASAHALRVSNQLRQSRWGDMQPQIFVASHLSNAETSGIEFAEANTKGLVVGRTFSVSESTIYGISLSVGTQELDIANTQLESDHWGLSVMLSMRRENLFFESQIGIAMLSYDDLSRAVKLGAKQVIAVGNTDGYSINVDVLTGFDIWQSDNWHIGPAVGVQLARALVRGYRETGGEIANYAWSSQRRERQIFRAGLVSKGDIKGDLSVFAELFAGKDFAGEEFSIGVNNTNSAFGEYQMPALVMADQIEISLKLGASMSLGNAGKLDINYTYSDRGDGTQYFGIGYSMAL